MSDLDNVIEWEMRSHQTATPPEPASLLAARRKAEEKAGWLRSLETEADGIVQQLADHPPRPIWQRLWGPSGELERQALEMRLDNLQRKILTARGNCAAATQVLKTQEQKYRVACAQHEFAQSARRVQSDARIITAQSARKFLEKNPRTALWGAPPLMQIAVDIQKARAEWRATPDSDASDDWSLIPILDLWGIPHLPPPKV